MEIPTEISQKENIRASFANVAASNNDDFKHAHEIYEHLVQEYMLREVTRSTDVFPAFAAIARTFASKGLGNYYAGLWSWKFPASLCWTAGGRKALGTAHHRDPLCDAPTWSWASIQGPVSFEFAKMPEERRKKRDKRFRNASVVNVSCEPMDGDTFGRVRAGRIEINAGYCEAQVQRAGRNSEDDTLYLEPSGGRLICSLDTEEDAARIEARRIWIVSILRYFGGAICLILRSDDAGDFRRVGVLVFWGLDRVGSGGLLGTRNPYKGPPQ